MGNAVLRKIMCEFGSCMCGEGEDLVPVWEGSEKEDQPDYLGCLTCGEMREVS